MGNFEITVLLVILVVTAVSGIFPFMKKASNPEGFSFPIGDALANGIFLGAGITILLFLLMEHIGGTLSKNNKGNLSFIAIMATIMLSIHSFFEGALWVYQQN